MSAIQQLLAGYPVAAGATDPNFANVSLLLHCDGANGSTTFTDSSPSPKTVSRNGTVDIRTSQSKFGGASAYFQGGADRLTVPSSSAFDFGTGDFTLEAWVRPNSASQTLVIMDRGRYADFTPWVLMLSGGVLRLACSNWFGSWDVCNINGTTNLAALTWHHVAATRSGTTFRIFVNGTQEGTATSATALGATTSVVQIGRDADSVYGFVGYMDDIRITKGVARYTGNFSVPTEAFPNS